MRGLLRSRRARAATLAAACLLILGSTLQLLSPRNQGVEGDWSAPAVPGRVVAGRAIVSGDNAALDLRSGTKVTLGSVRDGTPYVADDRLLVASPGRLDSVTLDATARWTWRAPAGSSVAPVAAGGGSTAVLVCPATGTCRLVGIDRQGRESWSSEGAERRDPLPSGALPRVDATTLGGGVQVTDPQSGRATLQPGRSLLALPDGPVVTEVVQSGRCVVSAYRSADPAWTQVLQSCPAAETPRLSADPVDSTVVTLTWPSQTVRLDLESGRAATAGARVTEGRRIARAEGLTALQARKTMHANPFRWGARATVLRVLDDRTGAVRAQVVSTGSLTLLHLDRSSLVVRDGDEVVRYSF